MSDSRGSWRVELEHRLDAYRTKRRKPKHNADQSHFSFEESEAASAAAPVTTEEEPAAADDDFSFTIAIGRTPSKSADSSMEIDVSVAPSTNASPENLAVPGLAAERESLYPVASMDERRLAGVIDAVCLLFAYGGFLTLFGSLGGQFTFSKLSAAVCLATLAIVYLQYFALFTVFGGSTPGMMLRGLQVASFSGEAPTPRQMLLRSAGYMLSAGTFCMGFLWAIWDEDGLAWHDRLSRTYLCPAPTFADLDATHTAHTA
ncbi:MAG TPA: RDD family protein [Candidatus Acidoferrum sp.]|nr:RDD family protein [Candidatus Acidoferrum sp.]